VGEPLLHKLRVRYAECDMQGVVFNSHYLAYIDVAVTELWRAAVGGGGYQGMLERGIDLVVAEAHLRFRRSARFDEELTLAIGVESLGNTSIITHNWISRDGEDLVQGTLRHVVVDRKTLAKTPIPDWLRAGLTPWITG
jgi:acyl-CoA thioester hydrolase